MSVAVFDASVAVFIPRKPHRPLKNPPVRNAAGTTGFCTLSCVVSSDRKVS